MNSGVGRRYTELESLEHFGIVDYAQATTQRKAHDLKLTERRFEFQMRKRQKCKTELKEPRGK